MEQGNQFRQPLPGSVAPAYQGSGAVHHHQEGMVSTDVPLQQQFMVDFHSKVDGKTYQGQFTIRKMSIKDIARIGVRKTQLNGGYHHDENNPGAGIPAESDFINQMMAYLEIAIVQAPMWFNLDEIYDADLLGDIFKKSSEFENNFFRSQRGQNDAPGSGENDSRREGEAPGSAGSVTQVVGGEVPTSLEP